MNDPAPLIPAILLVTEREAAKMLGICPKTIFNLAKSGELCPVKIGRAVRYSVDDLRQFIQTKQNTRGGKI